MDEFFTKEWIQDGRILCYNFRETSRATADAWHSDMVEVFRTRENDKPLLLLDVRMQGAFVSAHALVRARQVSALRTDLPGRTAILIASPTAAQVISSLIRTGLASGVRQRLVFADESRARQWLLESPKR